MRPALGKSALHCLANIPSVNLTVGCAHGCVYCYIRGYAQYPGEGRLTVYSDTAERVEKEISRKRRVPEVVYFCPSSDAFQPVSNVLEQSYRTMDTLLSRGIGIQFVTKGSVPGRFLELFARHPRKVAAQIGLATVDQQLANVLEPGASPIEARFATMRDLHSVGVEVSARADPLIAGVTDTDGSIGATLAGVAATGVSCVSASYLFLRPAIRQSLVRHIHDRGLLDRILEPYQQSQRLSLRAAGTFLESPPAAIREAGFARMRRIAQARGIAIVVCGCKNPDLTSGRCHLTRSLSAVQVNSPSEPAKSPSLWP